MTQREVIDYLIRDAMESGDDEEWNVELGERIQSMLYPNTVDDATLFDMMQQIEETLQQFFDEMNNLGITEKDYNIIKQAWNDCVIAGKDSFSCKINGIPSQHTLEEGKFLIKFYEVSAKRRVNQPQVQRLTLHYTKEGGILKFNGKDTCFASKGLIRTYKDGAELINNVDIVIQNCPVCIRCAEADGILVYCPECETLELIAYPIVGINEMMRPDPGYYDDPRKEFDDLDDEEWGFLKGSPD